MLCVDLRTNSDYFPKLTGYCNRDLAIYNSVVTICTTGLTCNCCIFGIYVFCIYLRTNNCFATYTINWLVFITQKKSFYCALRIGSLNKAACASSVKAKPHLSQHNYFPPNTDRSLLTTGVAVLCSSHLSGVVCL
jgi:hypothetical protein